MNSKKGVVEVQFNWVFVIIAGSIIFLFFGSLAMDYRRSAERELSAEILHELGSLTSSSLHSDYTAQEVEFGGIELSVSCNPDDCNQYGCTQEFDFAEIGITSPSWMALEPVFSARNIESNYIIIWSLPYHMPYKIGNFLFLTDPEHKYYFVYDEDDDNSLVFAESVYNRFSQNRFAESELVEKGDLPDIDYEGELRIRFVFFFDDSLGDDEQPENDVLKWSDILFVNMSSTDYIYGNVRYSKLSGDGKLVPDPDSKYPYIGESMLIGAIYSYNVEDYKCNVRKTMLKSLNLNQIYYDKMKNMYDICEESGSPCKGCEIIYSSAMDEIKDINNTITPDYDFDLESLYEHTEELKDLNDGARRHNCPRIY